MTTKVAQAVEAAAPKSWKDTAIRTLKTAVAAGIGAILSANMFNVANWKSAGMAGVTTGLTFLMNAALAWANSP